MHREYIPQVYSLSKAFKKVAQKLKQTQNLVGIYRLRNAGRLEGLTPLLYSLIGPGWVISGTLPGAASAALGPAL